MRWQQTDLEDDETQRLLGGLAQSFSKTTQNQEIGCKLIYT
jgi:hypothetical protein